MNLAASIVISILAGSAAAVGVTLALQPGDPTTDAMVVSDLQHQVGQLAETDTALEKRIAELAARPQSAAMPASAERTEAPSISDEQLAAAIAAYMAQHGGQLADAAATKDGAGKGFDLKKDLKSLLGTSYWENTAAWKRAFEAGEMDEVIKEMEALANASPNDTQSQMDLANAYMAYLQMDNSKWDLSMKADQQFDKVLDIDENHWEARFTKAMSYTFWPDFLGKKKEAIGHFETLVAQQEAMPVQDHQAQTYLFLGNMLAERDPTRAREIWQKGMTRHPNSDELRQKLGN